MITQNPDTGWFNLGAYRSQVYDGKTVGCQITEGKHGRIHRDKNFERGKPMKVAIVCGQDPLLFLLSSSPLPAISELDIAGGLRGEPIDVIRGPYTGFPIPADAEIVLEGETVPGQVRPEGPFGEWMGYYSDDTQPRPYVNVKTILHRNDPILCCAPQHKPDPLFLPGNFNNLILIDACIPYDMKLKGTFPVTVDVSQDLRAKLRAKFPHIFPPM